MSSFYLVNHTQEVFVDLLMDQSSCLSCRACLFYSRNGRYCLSVMRESAVTGLEASASLDEVIGYLWVWTCQRSEMPESGCCFVVSCGASKPHYSEKVCKLEDQR